MKIALDVSYLEGNERLFQGHEVIPFDRWIPDPETAIKKIGRAEVLGLRWSFPFPFDRKVIESFHDLKFIHKSGTGLDEFDLSALNDHGILLANNKGFNAGCVAEHVILLMLLCLRNTYFYISNMRNGVWTQDQVNSRVLQLEGKTVGIVGMGEIGCHIAKRLLPFGVNIIAYELFPRPDAAIFADVRWASLHEVLSESDVVTLHVPLTNQTEGLIGTRELGLMKPNAVLINCSRGRVVDERALYEALSTRRILAAGLDVFHKEPTLPDNPLLKLDNVVATPHIAALSFEMIKRQIKGTLDNIDLFVSGKRPLRLINPQIIEQRRARAKHLIVDGDHPLALKDQHSQM